MTTQDNEYPALRDMVSDRNLVFPKLDDEELAHQEWQAARANSGWLPISDEAKNHDFVELYYDHGSIELATFQQGCWRQKCDHSLMLTPYGITHYRIPTPPEGEE